MNFIKCRLESGGDVLLNMEDISSISLDSKGIVSIIMRSGKVVWKVKGSIEEWEKLIDHIGGSGSVHFL